jgi:signal transduction histidine kinase
MPLESGDDRRRGLFLALESLAGTPALLLDAQGNLEHANRKACDLMDCTGEAMLREMWPAIGPLFGVPPRTEPASSRPLLCSADIKLPAGSRLLSLELHPLERNAGHGHFAILRDRNALDHLERELLLASERRGWHYQHATLMHDLKGILNSMQISLELLSNTDTDVGEVSPEEARKLRRITILKEDLKRMNHALRAIPGASDNEDPAVTEFDARDVLKEILASLRQLVRRNSVELKFEQAQSALPVRGRRPWIKQALFNIAVHRLNAMRAGGTLAVEATLSEEGVVVNLRNDAPDMREGLIDESRRLFGPGRSGPGPTDLQVARAILESQGGALQVSSRIVDGTLFVVRLPR